MGKKRKQLAALAAATVLTGVGLGTATASAGDSAAARRHTTHHRASCGESRWSRSLEVVGLTDKGRLVCFEEHRPGKTRSIGTVRGLAGDTSLVGIDHRPATGELIGLGNAGGVYTIDVDRAVATKKSQLNMPLTGMTFGVDFNPTVDRLRIVGDDGQNLRANVDTGETTLDGVLNYTAGTPATGVTAAAYTNNDADPNTATTLYDIDSMLDQVAIQAPPNAGTLNPTGKLGVDTGPAVGFDIYSTIRRGTTVDVQGFASLSTNGGNRFAEVALFSGRVRDRGAFPSHHQVIDVAIPLQQR